VRPHKVDLSPTLPFSRKEMSQVLAACDEVRQSRPFGRAAGGEREDTRLPAAALGPPYRRRGDAPCQNVNGGRLLLHIQKTGVPVHLPLPPEVTKALDDMPRPNPGYFFWTGESTAHTITGK
jgi:hypothetical protein